MRKSLAVLIAAIAWSGAAFATMTDRPDPIPKTGPDGTKGSFPSVLGAPSAKVDINSASEKELMSLKGIGEVRAKTIAKSRPFKGKDDLVTRKIIPQDVYDGIKEQIVAKQM